MTTETDVDARGLTAREAADRLRASGPNRLPSPPRRHPLLALVVVLNGMFSFAGWTWGATPADAMIAVAIGTASGALFTAVVFGQLANAYACRSESRWVGRSACAVTGC